MVFPRNSEVHEDVDDGDVGNPSTPTHRRESGTGTGSTDDPYVPFEELDSELAESEGFPSSENLETSANSTPSRTPQSTQSVPITPPWRRIRANTSGQDRDQNPYLVFSPRDLRRLSNASGPLFNSPRRWQGSEGGRSRQSSLLSHSSTRPEFSDPDWQGQKGDHYRTDSPEISPRSMQPSDGSRSRQPSSLNLTSFPTPRPVESDRRDTTSSGTSYATGRRGAISAASVPPHPQAGTQQTMLGVHEFLATEEFGFRCGQQDRGAGRSRRPPNPFDRAHDEVWGAHYTRGLESTTPAVRVVGNPSSPSLPNFQWSPLVNVMTQTPEHPNGSYDPQWARQQCIRALTAMGASIATVLQRGRDWERIVVDVPIPIQEVLLNYPDLLIWYNKLQQDAALAQSGGCPDGYLV
ncbi:hypothetical protein K458DRAFT_26141 [Lentithecium fluviatile CBS 122367]|uniref:Uncharacterized protein n=1 Tax=Lentithecium fluviatile CBS 122367 TaxID=1168545 RepID=A0A6G1J3C7_9PLEO|nr:hypothetical protein K458DRAFT_26141 [Lentithecium fluviatile CBS 122367]